MSDSEPRFTKDNLPDWFCPVPFGSIIFNPEGNVTSCRELGADHALGDIRKETWQQIWNGEKFRALRREFLTGDIKTCAAHMRHRRCHKYEMNLELIRHIELSEVQTRAPARLSPDFNGHCNLECEMCTIWKKPNGLYDEVGFWEDAEKTLFPFLTQIDPLSGEPFIQKDTYRLMDEMAETNPEAAWKITTNAHWKFTAAIRERLERINLRTLNISVDSLVEENYARIRRKGDLRLVLSTIEALIRYRDERLRARGDTFVITLNILVQQHNWRELGEFLKFVRESGTRPLIQFLYGPRELSLLSLDRLERAEILQHYLDTIPALELNRHCMKVTAPLLESLRNPGASASPAPETALRTALPEGSRGEGSAPGTAVSSPADPG